MALAVVKTEFKLSKFFYSNFHDERVFYCCHWKLPRLVFLGVRILLALYSLYALTHYFVYFTLLVSTKQNTMVYFTTWSYLVLTIHLTLAAVLAAIFYRKVNYERPFTLHIDHSIVSYSSKRYSANAISGISKHQPVAPPHPPGSEDSQESHKQLDGDSKAGTDNSAHYDQTKENDKAKISDASGNCSHSTYESFHGDPSCEQVLQPTRWYFRLSWALSDVIICAAPVVTSIYFAAIYPTMKERTSISVQDLNVHILNSVLMVIDFVLSARPIRILHFWTPILYGVSWTVFSAIYWSTDHVNHIVYKFIDWSKPGTTLIWAGGLGVAFVLLVFVYFALYRLKLWLYSSIHEEEHFVIVDDHEIG